MGRGLNAVVTATGLFAGSLALFNHLNSPADPMRLPPLPIVPERLPPVSKDDLRNQVKYIAQYLDELSRHPVLSELKDVHEVTPDMAGSYRELSHAAMREGRKLFELARAYADPSQGEEAHLWSDELEILESVSIDHGEGYQSLLNNVENGEMGLQEAFLETRERIFKNLKEFESVARASGTQIDFAGLSAVLHRLGVDLTGLHSMVASPDRFIQFESHPESLEAHVAPPRR